MKLTPHHTRHRINRLAVNLTSMIDITFLLLIYFMLATVLASTEDTLSPTLQVQAEAAAGPTSDFQPQIIEVMSTEEGIVYQVGSRRCATRGELVEVLLALPKEVGLFIHVHDGANVGAAVAAMQVAHDAGFEEVTYVPAK